MQTDASKKFVTPKGSAAFPWPETALVERFGLSPERMAGLRSAFLQATADWAPVKRNICWSTLAVRKVARLVGFLPEHLSWIDQHPFSLEPDEKAPPPQKVVMELKVEPRKTMNPHIILATDGENVFRVRVKSKEKFRPGMVVRCAHVELDLFELVGNCPRFHGKY